LERRSPKADGKAVEAAADEDDPSAVEKSSTGILFFQSSRHHPGIGPGQAVEKFCNVSELRHA